MDWVKYEASLASYGSQTGSPPRHGGRGEAKALTTGYTEEHGGKPSPFAVTVGRFPARGFLLGRFGHDQAVRLANQAFEFVGGQDVRVLEKNPFIAADVWGRGDAFNFEEVVELVQCRFEGDGGKVAFGEIHDSEDLAAHFEAEVFTPLKLFGRVGEREAESANPVGVGHGEMIARGAAPTREDR